MSDVRSSQHSRLMTDASRLLRLSCCSCWCWNDVKMRLYVIAHCWWLLTSLTIRSKYTVYRYPLGIADNSSHRLRVKTNHLTLSVSPTIWFISRASTLSWLRHPQPRRGEDWSGDVVYKSLWRGVVSSGNIWKRRSWSYFDSGNTVPRNAIVR